MDMPALIRPLRRTLQGQLRFPTTRFPSHRFPSACRVHNVWGSQIRSNFTDSTPPGNKAAPVSKETTPAIETTPPTREASSVGATHEFETTSASQNADRVIKETTLAANEADSNIAEAAPGVEELLLARNNATPETAEEVVDTVSHEESELDREMLRAIRQDALARKSQPPGTTKPEKQEDTSVSRSGGRRLPRSLSALYLAPLRRQAEYGVPSCDLQLRSFSIPNLEFFCDFALRAAYYLGLPADGPIPLPRMVERWTVPKSTFIFKKSQENFERVTLRRLIQIKDGHPETVQIWLAFLQKHQYYGVGLKANVWEFSKLEVGKHMDAAAKEIEGALEDEWAHLGQHNSGPNDTIEKIEEFLIRERVKAETMGYGHD